MKNLFIGLIAVLTISFTAFAQSNNPQNQLGEDVVKFAVTVKNDINSGKLKELNQTEIDRYYDALLKGQENPSLENYKMLMEQIKVSDPKAIIENTRFSEEAKNFLTASLTDISTTELVNQVNKSEINALEKEIVLKVLAINYNIAISYIYKPVSVGRGPSYSHNSLVNDCNDYSKGLTLLGAGIFFIAGNALCGPPCGWGMAFLGAVLVNSFPTTITTTNSGHSSGGSSSSSPKP